MGQPALMPEPVIRLLRQFADAPRTEEFWSASRSRGLFCDRFDAIFTIFIERAIVVGIRPCTSRTIETIKLVEMSEGRNAPKQARFLESNLSSLKDRLQSGSDPWWRCDLNRVGLNRRLGVSHADIAARRV